VNKLYLFFVHDAPIFVIKDFARCKHVMYIFIDENDVKFGGYGFSILVSVLMISFY